MERAVMVWMCVLCAGTAIVAVAQEPVAQFAGGVKLVEVYASVADADGRPVRGLRRSDFVVVEDGERQTIEAFAAGEFPLVVALGVDRSFSMAGEPLRLARSAAQTFLQSLRPTDRSMIVSISSEAEVLAPMSTDRLAQVRALAAVDVWGTTALNDAIVAALDRLAAEPGRQALVLFSDGVDRFSVTPASQVLDRARRSGALVYPITFGRRVVPHMTELAALTGGRALLLRDARGLENALRTIAEELRHQYLLGYAPSRPLGQGEWRSIRVSLATARPGARVRARDGYTAN